MKPTPSDAELLAEFIAACDEVGIPHHAPSLVRHHRGNAQLIGALAARHTDASHDGSARVLRSSWDRRLEVPDADDDALVGNELLTAASCYMLAATYAASRGEAMPLWIAEGEGWPFGPDAWAPAANPVDCLELAGALVVAEMDRLTRAAESNPLN